MPDGLLSNPQGCSPRVSAGSCSCSEQGSLQTHQWCVADKIVNRGIWHENQRVGKEPNCTLIASSTKAALSRNGKQPSAVQRFVAQMG